jgi:hypothetical protein
MSRRLFAVAFVAGLIAAQFGCHTCDRSASSASCAACSSRTRANAPYQTAAGQGAVGQPVGLTGGCFDAVTGQPVPCPPDVPGSPYPIPGGSLPAGPAPRGVELPMPLPSEQIPTPSQPYPAPAREGTLLPFPSAPGTPVKAAPNK